MSLARTTGTFLAFFLAAALPATASTVCETLEAQLRQPVRVLGNRAQIKRQTDALARQERIILRIDDDMRRYGCTGRISIEESDRAQLCAEIGDALLQAQSERQRVSEARDRALSEASDDNDRQRIMAALNANGCPDAATQPDPPAAPGRSPRNDAPPSPGRQTRRETASGEQQPPFAAPSPSKKTAIAPPQEQPETVPERDYDPNDSRVRVIGPKFLTDAASPIDLKHPALKGAQPQQ